MPVPVVVVLVFRVALRLFILVLRSILPVPSIVPVPFMLPWFIVPFCIVPLVVPPCMVPFCIVPVVPVVPLCIVPVVPEVVPLCIVPVELPEVVVAGVVWAKATVLKQKAQAAVRKNLVVFMIIAN